MISATSKGDFRKTRTWINKILHGEFYSELSTYGEMGVDALSRATPIDTGLTSKSWRYKVIQTRGHTGIEWYNTNLVANTPVVILLQYGHGTGTGGYVAGKDFINPAMRPIFDKIAYDVWKKVIA